jgi:hypothetical protein
VNQIAQWIGYAVLFLGAAAIVGGLLCVATYAVWEGAKRTGTVRQFLDWYWNIGPGKERVGKILAKKDRAA